MKRALLTVLFLVALTSCQKAEIITVEAVNGDREAYMDETVRLQGTRVKESSSVGYVTTGLLRYFVLEDDSGRIRVFYNVASRRCPPRMGAKVTIAGRIVLTEPDQTRIFLAKSVSVDDQIRLAENQVRMCELSLNEAQAYAEWGEEGLREFWNSEGKPAKELVFD